ncbi:MAG: transporter substrate-binding domain-containing protein [Breznakia sp.]
MKRLAGIMVGVALILTGCEGTSSSSSDDNTFVVGMECNYAPFNWQTNQESDTSVAIGGAGFCDGYDVMIAQSIADELDRELEIKKVAWDGLQPALQSGEIDAIIAGMTANEDRENGIDFTTPYFASEMVMIVRKGSEEATYNNIQQFRKKTVIGQKNTNYDDIIDQIENVIHATPKASYPEMIVTLQSQEVDAITAELPVAQGAISANADLAIVRFAQGKGFDIDTSVSIGLKEGSRDSDFFNAVQSALDKITQAKRDSWMEQARNNQPSQE